jgi:hypothetical protein
MVMTAMDSLRAVAIDGAMVMQGRSNVQRQANIKIKEEEILRRYDKGALPLVAMPLLLHAHFLIQIQG